MNLNICCPINTLSYGYVSSFFIKELIKLEYDIRVVMIGRPSPDGDLAEFVNDVLSRQDFFYDAPCLKIWHQHDLHTYVGKRESIGFPIFELEDFKPVEKHSCGYPDYLFTCSSWGKNVLINNGLKEENIHVVPLGFNDELFKPCQLPSDDKTIFGNFGKFEIRKGHDVLVEAFNKAFEKDDDVELMMMPHNPFLNESSLRDWVLLYKNSKLGNKISFVDRVSKQSDVYDVMKRIHCGVFPARAEGWNLEALELLACGKHLIITNCAGHTEFCNKENSRLIEMESGYETAFDGVFFDGAGRWSAFEENEMDQLVHHMREVHKERAEGRLTLNQSGVDMSSEFTWDSVTKVLDQKLKLVTS